MLARTLRVQLNPRERGWRGQTPLRLDRRRASAAKFPRGAWEPGKVRESVIVDFAPIETSKIGELAAKFDIVLGVTPEA